MRTSYRDINIRLAKADLCKQLLDLTNEELTCNEADILYLLSRDVQIQQILDKAIEKENQ